jgi:DnaJ-class molecular chaperone
MADYYAILGISHASQSDEIAKAYRRAALTYNPECNPAADNPAELKRRFKLVSQAYVVLSDVKTRAIYDAYAESGVRHGGTFEGGNSGLDIDAVDPDVVFRRFFGVDNPFQVIGDTSGLHGTQHHFYSEAAAAKPAQPLARIPVPITVTLEDVFQGALKTAKWERNGSWYTMDVQVPRGVRHGSRIPFTHTQGGDIEVVIEVEKHERYARDGNNLIIVVPITLADALVGTTVKVPLIDSREVDVLLDEIAHPAFELPLYGEGLPDPQTGKRGDLIVRCSTAFPKYLSAEQKRELRRILG